MGMARRIGQLWGQANAQYLTHQQQASDVAGGLGAFSKVLRMTLQSGVLGIGAYLVIHSEATGGIMIASSILVVPGARSGRTRHRQLEGLRRRPPGLARLSTLLEDDGPRPLRSSFRRRRPR